MFVFILLPFVGFIQMATLLNENFQLNSTLHSIFLHNQSNPDSDSSLDESIIFGNHSDVFEKNELVEDCGDKDEINTEVDTRSKMKLSFSDLTLSMYKILAEEKNNNFVFSPLR